jgi:hypothetical protein
MLWDDIQNIPYQYLLSNNVYMNNDKINKRLSRHMILADKDTFL